MSNPADNLNTNAPLVMGMDSLARLHSLTLDQLRRRMNGNPELRALLTKIGGVFVLPVASLTAASAMLTGAKTHPTL